MIKWEKNDHTSQNIVDEFHQLESKVEYQVNRNLRKNQKVKVGGCTVTKVF